MKEHLFIREGLVVWYDPESMKLLFLDGERLVGEIAAPEAKDYTRAQVWELIRTNVKEFNLAPVPRGQKSMVFDLISIKIN